LKRRGSEDLAGALSGRKKRNTTSKGRGAAPGTHREKKGGGLSLTREEKGDGFLPAEGGKLIWTEGRGYHSLVPNESRRNPDLNAAIIKGK